eukprot:14927529-Alexandrium_andersonii.AAC.1
MNSRSPTRCVLIPGDGRGPWHVLTSWALACLNSLRVAFWFREWDCECAGSSEQSLRIQICERLAC